MREGAQKNCVCQNKQTGCFSEWWCLKPYFGLFHNYCSIRAPIDEITSKGSSCSLFATRAVSSNSYAPSCRYGRCLCIIPLRHRHSLLFLLSPKKETLKRLVPSLEGSITKLLITCISHGQTKSEAAGEAVRVDALVMPPRPTSLMSIINRS